MESLLSLLVFIPFYSKKIENKYLTNLLFIIVSVFIAVTYFVNYEVFNINFEEYSYTFTGMKNTNYFILLVLGLLSQLRIKSNSLQGPSDYIMQTILMLWFGLINNVPIVLVLGYLLMNIIISVNSKKNILEQLLIFSLLIFSYVQEVSLFQLNSISAEVMVTITTLLIVLKLKAIKTSEINYINYYTFLMLLTLTGSLITKLNINLENMSYLYLFSLLLVSKDIFLSLCRIIIYFLSIGILVDTLNIYVAAPVILLLFVLPKNELGFKDTSSNIRKITFGITLLFIPLILEKIITHLTQANYILIILFIFFLSISVRNYLLKGVDYKNKSIQVSIFLVFTGLIMIGIEQL
jgi:hypothetical protein